MRNISTPMIYLHVPNRIYGYSLKVNNNMMISLYSLTVVLHQSLDKFQHPQKEYGNI